MRSIPFSGTIPSLLPENARPHGWAGALTIGIDPAQVSLVDVVGTADLYIDSRFDRSTGTVQLWNIATPDYDGFTRIGANPVMHFQVRVFLTDGTQGLSAATYAIGIGNVDDSPPSALGFATGGTVTPGDIGATIGTLAVTDVDSAGPFSFTIAEADAWQYEVVGTTLRLKPGMTVAISDGPYRALNVEVSDGLQSAAFRLDIRVEFPTGGERAVLDILDPWETQAGFSWKNADTVWATHTGSLIAGIESYGGEVTQVRLTDGHSAWLPRVQKIEFLNGSIDMREHGSADMINAAYLAVLGRLADRFSLPPAVEAMDAGRFKLTDLIGYMLDSQEFQQRYGTLSNEQFVRMLYRNTEGGIPFEPGVRGWTGALDAGMPRVNVAEAFTTWEVNLNNVDTLHPGGWWLERFYGAHLTAIYDLAPGRLQRAGFEYWMEQLGQGRIDLIGVAKLFAATPEFQALLAPAENAAFVRGVYESVLDRPVDAWALNYWTTRLVEGSVTREGMAIAVGLGDEKIGSLSQLPPGEPFFS